MKVFLVAAAVLLYVVTLGHSQVPPEPTEQQLQCFNNSVEARLTEFSTVCATVLAQDSSVNPCSSGDCYDLLFQLFIGCGYNISAACTIGPVIPPFPSIGDAFAPLGLTPRQEECVNQQIFGSRSPDFTRACSHVLVSDPDDAFRQLCLSADCRQVVGEIVMTCEYPRVGIDSVCHGIGIPTGGTIGVPITGFPTDGVPDDPFNLTPEQAACISASPRISNLAAQCSGLDPENPLREICGNGGCRQAFGDILMDCEYDRQELDNVCQIGTSVTGETPMEDPLNLTPEQSACLDQLFSSSSPSQRVINFAIQCSGVDPEDPHREVCGNGDCRQAFGDILMDCEYDRQGLDDVCSGGPTPTPDVYTSLGIQAPSADQELCFAVESQARAVQAIAACPDLMNTTNILGSIQMLCSDGDCRKVYEEIFGACNYNVLTAVCDSSIKVYAVPLLVFVSVLLSVVF